MAMTSRGRDSLQCRFDFLQKGIVQTLFKHYLFCKDNFYRSVCLRVFRNMMTSNCRNRMKEMKGFSRIQKEMEKIALYVKENYNRESLIADIEEAKEKKAIICAQCTLIEEPGVLFQKCGRCKMAFYCSRKCQKKHYKIHKKVCNPVRGSE